MALEDFSIHFNVHETLTGDYSKKMKQRKEKKIPYIYSVNSMHSFLLKEEQLKLLVLTDLFVFLQVGLPAL